MTQPQPPPSNQPKSGSANSTLDDTSKYKALRKILYDITLPKTSHATTCVFPLKNLLKARSLIDAINDTVDTPPTTSLETLCTKLEELAAQVDELKNVHTHTTIPPTTQDTIQTKPRKSYAAATTAQAPTPAPTGTRSQPPDHSHIETPRNSTRRPPPDVQQPKRIIMRFIGPTRHPAENERMTSYDMRNAVNEALSHAKIEIIGAEYTRAGNIALTPHPSCTTDQLLKHCDIIGPPIAHGCSTTDEIVFEHDRIWYNVVVGGIRLPRHRDNLAEVEKELCTEILEWNRTFGTIKWARLLCREEDLWKKDRGAFLISFEGREQYEKVLRDGAFAFGEHCKASPYRFRQFINKKQQEDI
jgi:hypothetical protein